MVYGQESGDIGKRDRKAAIVPSAFHGWRIWREGGAISARHVINKIMAAGCLLSEVCSVSAMTKNYWNP